MLQLAERECVACTKESLPVSRSEAEKLLAQLPGWVMSADNTLISKRFTFKNFVDALNFANAVGEVAERAWHHPDMKLGWGYVEVAFQTHSIGGLHVNDFILAARVELLASA